MTLVAQPVSRIRAALLAVACSLATLAVAGAGGPTAELDPALAGVRDAVVKIVVQERAPSDHAERVVRRSGGTVSRDLPIVGGFSATVPRSAVAELASVPTVRVVSLDRRVRVLGDDAPGKTPTSVFRKVVRAESLNNNGHDGTGVTVALIDTGVADVADLRGRILRVRDDQSGAVSPCMNFSGEADCADAYGHGTFMAGLIAGNGAASSGKWQGTAPAANILSVKIAGRDGAADVSNVLAAIQWVVSFKDRYGVRVLNLSLGTDSTQSTSTDPLNYAVQKAWDAGIVVVVAAGNNGPDARTISKPADDPLVITVGAIDDRGTNSLSDDELPDFSGRGPTAADGIAKPDLAAPGAHVVSLRAPGSEIDNLYPSAIDGAYRKGSGTSMAAAVVSGVAASLLEANPGWTPNRMKHALKATARSAASTDINQVGAGVPDAHGALAAPAGEANAGVRRSSGLGLIDLSRGSVAVQTDDPLGTVVNGTLTAQLLLYDPIGYTGTEWTGARWYDSQWSGARWYGARWYGSTWTGARWYGARWYGETLGARWYGNEWHGARWYGAWE